MSYNIEINHKIGSWDLSSFGTLVKSTQEANGQLIYSETGHCDVCLNASQDY